MCVVSSVQIVASIYLQRSKYVTNSVSDVTPVAGLPPSTSTAYYTNNPLTHRCVRSAIISLSISMCIYIR